jgi:two-component system chemotaxis sensor kinase CheA
MINKLSISYKCQSSIGNSLILDEMIKEVLTTFSEETDALHSAFYLFRNNSNEHICSIGKKVNYEIDLLLEKSSKDRITLIKHSESLNLILYRLEDGVFVFIYDKFTS